MPDSNDVLQPLAIIGFSINFPDGATTPDAFWRMLEDKKCASRRFPKDRVNVESFYHPDGTRTDSFPVRNAHFLQQDIGAFDAPFFSLTPAEALSIDPQHRGLMECAYHALENAGVPLEKVANSKTGVFCGSFTDDYRINTYKDIATMPKHAATGVGQNFTANRLSWAFNLKGPSLQIDTACSSSLIALDVACQSLRSGDSEMALVGGCNIISSVETSIALSSMGFLSPDGRCFSFDERGNGYARGEGFGVLVVKRLSDAVRDGDLIRAVIRSTGSNQNGRSRSITQTSRAEQVELMQQTYRKAGLDLAVTRFVEAHGTGTEVGDPTEANAIGDVFGRYRTQEAPIYIGAVKSNIGHLEGASGIAGIVKSIIALEKGIIPPNTNFQKLNPRIKAKANSLSFPTTSIPWPVEPQIRRASINSFGFGGSNAHVVLDDAHSFLTLRGIHGNHSTTSMPSMENNHGNDSQNFRCDTDSKGYILPFSALNSEGISRLCQAYTTHFNADSPSLPCLTSLAYTLANRRSKLQTRAFALLKQPNELRALPDLLTKPIRSSSKLGLGFIFTGQGAQYVGMGRELFQYSAFNDAFLQVEEAMRATGCQWSLVEELMKPAHESRISQPEYSQPLCTALQISLVHFLRSCGIQPATVVGHSSGEIAAAYTAGGLSLESACKVAHLRGKLAATLSQSESQEKGGMLAVGLSEAEVQRYFSLLDPDPSKQRVVAGCINSPTSVTVSGDSDRIGQLKEILDANGVFNRVLNVDVAYHSSHMLAIASPYADALHDIVPGNPTDSVMISSVTGDIVSMAEVCKPEYWVRNLVSPVKFRDTMTVIANARPMPVSLTSNGTCAPPLYHLIELGPHSTLQGPIRDTLAQSLRGKDISYLSAIKRNEDPPKTLLNAVGTLWCYGYQVDFTPINKRTTRCGQNKPKLLANLPEYPFDHSRSYFHRPRLHNDFLQRNYGSLDLLGAPVIGFNPLNPAWRKIIRISDTPWVEDHQINGNILYPAAGMLVMAIEAARLMAQNDREIQGFRIKEASFEHSLTIPSSDVGVETQLHLRSSMNDPTRMGEMFEFSLYSHADGTWSRNCQGEILIEYSTQDTICSGPAPRTVFQNQSKWVKCEQQIDEQNLYKHLNDAGFHYGPMFQGLSRIQHDNGGRCTADVELFPWAEQEEANHQQDHIIHPTSFDILAQLALVGLTNGARVLPPTTLPTAARNIYVAAHGLSHPLSTTVKAFSETKLRGERHNEFSIIAIDHETGQLLLEWEHLETTNIGTDGDGQESYKEKQQCYYLDIKPDISLLTEEGASKYCAAAEYLPNLQFRNDLEEYMTGTFMSVMERLAESDIDGTRPHHRKYMVWMREKFSDFSAKRSASQLKQLKDSVYFDALRSRIEQSGSEGKFYAEVGRNLEAVLRGQVDPLAILFETGLAKGLYQDLNARLSESLSRLLDLIAHRNPDTKIVEIGAGTGGTSAIVLDSLTNGTTARFDQYDYTDISASYFESAKSTFSTSASKMNFKIMDIETDPAKQGFERSSYDLLIAANVLHATKSLTQTLKNAHSLLKPGGKLILLEITNSMHQGGFAMGLLPGWWLGTEQYRQSGPCISEDRWNSVLQTAGFSGLDVALRDFPNSDCHEQSILVSTALEQGSSTNNDPIETIILVDIHSELQEAIASELQQKLTTSKIASSESITPEDIKGKFCISLLHLDRPHDAFMDEKLLSYIKTLVSNAFGLLWVSSDNKTLIDKAQVHIVDGLRRVLTSENDGLRFVTLALETHTDTTNYTRNIVATYKQTIKVSTEAFEEEYVEKNGILCIKRLSEAKELNDNIENGTAPVAQTLEFGDGHTLRLDFEFPGVLDSIRFIEDTRADELQETETEIEVKATGLNFRDCLIALGRMKDSMKTIGFEMSGLVTRVGSGSAFHIGDRVYGLVPSGCFTTFAVTHSSLLNRIPGGLSFPEAAGLPSGMLTAYHSLVGVAQLQAGESVLIHSAAGGTGQIAVQIAQYIGATVFVTVGSEEKKRLLIERYHIPEQHIFSSRSTAFASHIKRLTNGRGVDVVLNSLSDDKLVASWESIAPFGRMIEIGKKDVLSNSKLPMRPFAKNITYAVVDVFGMSQERPDMCHSIFKKVSELVQQQKVSVPHPLHVYGVNQIEDAFRYMQSGQNIGKITIEMRKTEEVKALVSARITWMFDKDASYLIAGGFGGIARSTARWMASRGARHLILLSRSGARPGKSAELVADLESQGVRVAAPKCDVSDEYSLIGALDWCKDIGMPPVKGCIQGSMVLKDAIFDNMTLEDWNTTIKPRVKGTWNLHTMLPSGMDFFIMFSSVAGIVGSAGQANYAASNNYLDEFARYRISIGEKATSFDLGWMQSEGTIAENDGLARAWIVAGCWIPVSQPNLFALLDHYCDPNLKHEEHKAQVMIGLGPPWMVHAKGITDLPPFFNRSLFRNLHHMQVDGLQSQGLSSESGNDQDYASLLHSAKTSDEASDYVVQALVRRVAKAMAMPVTEIDSQKPLHKYGVDSLLAIELRTWFRRYFDIDVPVFDLLGAKNFYIVAEKALKDISIP